MRSLSALNRRLNFALWQCLEIAVRWVVLSRSERAAMREQRDRSFKVLTVEDPGQRMGALGHGCTDSGRAMFAAVSFDPLPQPPGERALAEACVIGEGAAAQEAIRRLVALGVRTHATAEDYAAVLANGATPRRAGDLTALMPRLDILILASPSYFAGARLIAHLPEGALIADFSPPPGSVDFETAKRLGRTVLWARGFDSGMAGRPDPWAAIAARVKAIMLERK